MWEKLIRKIISVNFCFVWAIMSSPVPISGQPPNNETMEHISARLKRRNISWPTQDKLCEVRLFAAEDAPCFSGAQAQDLYQAKQTRFMHTTAPFTSDDLPPGFEGVAATRAEHDAKAIEVMVPEAQWHCPPKFMDDHSWQVVAGEGSEEVEAQVQREVRVLEAVYPRASVIPQSPAEPQETDLDTNDDASAAVPQIPLEDESEMDEDHPQGENGLQRGDGEKVAMTFLKEVDPQVAAAAAAAAYAAVKLQERGNMIDQDLLAKILNNPQLIETLLLSAQNPLKLAADESDSAVIIKGHPIPAMASSKPSIILPLFSGSNMDSSYDIGRSMKSTQLMLGQSGNSSQTGIAGGLAGYQRNGLTDGLSEQLVIGQPPNNGQPSKVLTPSLHHGFVNRPTVPMLVSSSIPLTRNLNGDRQQQIVNTGPPTRFDPVVNPSQLNRFDLSGKRAGMDHQSGVYDRQLLGKPWKPCFYFNTPRGCRNGANCPYIHDPDRPRMDFPPVVKQLKRPRLEPSGLDLQNLAASGKAEYERTMSASLQLDLDQRRKREGEVGNGGRTANFS